MRRFYFCLMTIFLLWGIAYGQSNNADLDVLQVRVTGGAQLVPAFSKEHTEYEVKVHSDIGAIEVRAAAWVGASKIRLNNVEVRSLAWYRSELKIGPNRLEVNVLAPDGKKTKNYTIAVQREDIKPVADAFLKFVHTDPTTGLSMPYRLFVPANYDPAKIYPLVLFLHGGGERGDDNAKQLYGTEGPTIWAKPEEQAKRPAFILAPQAHAADFPASQLPYTGFGVTRNSLGERYMDQAFIPSMDLKLAVQVLERVQREYSGVDSKRLYVTGLSQGGFGTWNINLLRPDLFAAMVPISGGGDPSQMSKLVGKPIWAFHAEDDQVIPVRYSRDSIGALRKAGGNPIYTELPSGTFLDPNEHWSWVYAYRNEAMREWLFKQIRP